MIRFLPVLPIVVALSACAQPTVHKTNASVEEVAAASRTAVKLEPGKWQTVVKVVSIDAPGLPAAMASAIKRQMAASGTQTVDQCITPEMAAKPPEKMFASATKNCRFENFTMAGGKVDGTLVCGAAAGMPHDLRSTMSGTFSSTSYSVSSESAMDMPAMPGAAAGSKITTKTEVTGKHLGACDNSAGT